MKNILLIGLITASLLSACMDANNFDDNYSKTYIPKENNPSGYYDPLLEGLDMFNYDAGVHVFLNYTMSDTLRFHCMNRGSSVPIQINRLTFKYSYFKPVYFKGIPFLLNQFETVSDSAKATIVVNSAIVNKPGVYTDTMYINNNSFYFIEVKIALI